MAVWYNLAVDNPYYKKLFLAVALFLLNIQYYTESVQLYRDAMKKEAGRLYVREANGWQKRYRDSKDPAGE